MAPFRSSRSNRHLQHENVPRNRGGAGGPIDHDPTEGLPVKKWQLTDVTVKQEAKDDDGDDTRTGNVNPDYPWPELPLPKDFHQLPIHSQELLRRARMGNTRVRPAVYNPSTGTYTNAPLPSTATNGLKSKHLTNPTTPPIADIDMIDDADELDPDAVTTQKPTLEEDRAFTVRKWALVPAAIADKRPEPKYLADRRPGLPSLYGRGAPVAATPANIPTGDPGLGFTYTNADGGTASTGLSLDNTSGFGGGSAAGAPIEAPRRRGPPPPPKRKKKGGIGRRKKVQIEVPSSEQVASTDGGANIEAISSEIKTEGGIEDPTVKEEEDEEGSGSDEDGSEEGEIDEGGDTTMNTPAPVEDAPKITDLDTAVAAEVAFTETVEEVPKAEEPEVTVPAVIEPEDVGEAIPPTIDKANEVFEQEKPVAPVAMTTITTTTVPTIEEVHVEDSTAAADAALSPTPSPAAAPPLALFPAATGEVPEVDLLGSLDLAVKDMEGADAMDVSEDKHATSTAE